jgi:hypothetical protein
MPQLHKPGDGILIAEHLVIRCGPQEEADLTLPIATFDASVKLAQRCHEWEIDQGSSSTKEKVSAIEDEPVTSLFHV